MIEKLASYLAPHYCYSCTKIGSVLCDNCKFYILDDMQELCINCQKPSFSGICVKCIKRVDYKRVWLVGKRQDALEGLINAYKFQRVKSAIHACVELLDSRLPILPENTIIVPVPTVAKHIRIRGYDHTAILAEQIAKRRNLNYSPILNRQHSLTQLGSDAKTRHAQAASAFRANETLHKKPHLLIDDVVTTGATLKYASKALKDAGANEVWAAILARQNL